LKNLGSTQNIRFPPKKIIDFELNSCEKMLKIKENKLEMTYNRLGREVVFEKSPKSILILKECEKLLKCV